MTLHPLEAEARRLLRAHYAPARQSAYVPRDELPGYVLPDYSHVVLGPRGCHSHLRAPGLCDGATDFNAPGWRCPTCNMLLDA